MEESHQASVYTIDGTLTPISPFFPLRQMKEYISLLMFPYFHFSILSKLALPTNTFTKISHDHVYTCLAGLLFIHNSCL